MLSGKQEGRRRHLHRQCREVLSDPRSATARLAQDPRLPRRSVLLLLLLLMVVAVHLLLMLALICFTGRDEEPEREAACCSRFDARRCAIEPSSNHIELTVLPSLSLCCCCCCSAVGHCGTSRTAASPNFAALAADLASKRKLDATAIENIGKKADKGSNDAAASILAARSALRAKAADKLTKRLTLRPPPAELVRRNILGAQGACQAHSLARSYGCSFRSNVVVRRRERRRSSGHRAIDTGSSISSTSSSARSSRSRRSTGSSSACFTAASDRRQLIAPHAHRALTYS